jgi:hypothetical protein
MDDNVLTCACVFYEGNNIFLKTFSHLYKIGLYDTAINKTYYYVVSLEDVLA